MFNPFMLAKENKATVELEDGRIVPFDLCCPLDAPTKDDRLVFLGRGRIVTTASGNFVRGSRDVQLFCAWK